MSSTSRTQGTADTSYGSSTTTTTPPQFDPRVLMASMQQKAPGSSWWDTAGDFTQMLMMLYGMGAFDKGKGTSKKSSGGAGALPWYTTGDFANQGAPPSGYRG